MTLADIWWQTMQVHARISVNVLCNEYETNPKYKVLKIVENGDLKGFGVYHDHEGIRYIHSVHYIGQNKYVALKFWKWFKRGAKKMRVIVQKSNKTMLDMVLKLGFKVVSEDLNNYILERGD